MADVLLKGLSRAEMVATADALLRAGKVGLARSLYEALVAQHPDDTTLRSRLAMTLKPDNLVPAMIEVLQLLERIRPVQAFVGAGLATWLKDPPFMDDARFLQIADRHAALGQMPGWYWNLSVVLWAARRALMVGGDFVELGVFKGHTSLFLAEYLEFGRQSRRWWLYDTFEGIPEDRVQPGWEEANRRIYGGTFSREEIEARFAPFGNFVVTKGRVPEVLAEAAPEAIAFMHIDLNNPAAEVGALDALYERISPGGVIVFDDFGWTAARAQRLAETAWFAARGLEVLTLPTGQGLVIKP